MKPPVLALFSIAYLGACASHNSHSVGLQPGEHLLPLVEEALGHLQENLGGSLPSDFVAVEVGVEPVTVRWVMPEDAPSGTAGAAAPADLQPFLLEAVHQYVAMSDPAEALYVMNVELEIDLHDPGELGLRISCDLTGTGETRNALARGHSSCIRLQRLYCHGCRDAWGGLGSDIDQGSTSGSYAVGYVPIPVCEPSHAGYTKH